MGVRGIGWIGWIGEGQEKVRAGKLFMLRMFATHATWGISALKYSMYVVGGSHLYTQRLCLVPSTPTFSLD